MGLTEEEIKRLYRIQKTLMQMLKDRGYFIADSEITMSLSQFVRKYGDNMKREDLVTLKAKRNDSSDQVLSLCLRLSSSLLQFLKVMKGGSFEYEITCDLITFRG